MKKLNAFTGEFDLLGSWVSQDYVDTLISSVMKLQWDWNASTNTPNISSTTKVGYTWRISTDWSTNIGWITDWKVWDMVVKTSTGWMKIDNTEASTPTSRTLTINGVALDLSADRSWTVWASGGSYLFAIAGTIGATGTNVANVHLCNGTKTITSVDLWYGTAGSWTLTVDVMKNGTTIFATTKPTITTTNQWSIASGTLTTTSLASGDYLRLDIIAIPWTTLPVDLYVRVNYS
jgi:hypothetical protein